MESKVDALFRTSAEVCSSCTTATPLHLPRRAYSHIQDIRETRTCSLFGPWLSCHCKLFHTNPTMTQSPPLQGLRVLELAGLAPGKHETNITYITSLTTPSQAPSPASSSQTSAPQSCASTAPTPPPTTTIPRTLPHPPTTNSPAAKAPSP